MSASCAQPALRSYMAKRQSKKCIIKYEVHEYNMHII